MIRILLRPSYDKTMSAQSGAVTNQEKSGGSMSKIFSCVPVKHGNLASTLRLAAESCGCDKIVVML